MMIHSTRQAITPSSRILQDPTADLGDPHPSGHRFNTISPAIIPSQVAAMLSPLQASEILRHDPIIARQAAEEKETHKRHGRNPPP